MLVLRLSCSAVGHGIIKYQWERYLTSTNEWTTLSTDQQNDIVNISMYTIENLNKGNNGVYCCGASNVDGISYSINTTITVYGKENVDCHERTLLRLLITCLCECYMLFLLLKSIKFYLTKFCNVNPVQKA